MGLDRRAAREHSVLTGLQRFCEDQGLGSPSPLVTEVIGAYLCQGLCDRAPSTRGTYHSVLRGLGERSAPKGPPRFAGSLAPSPYDPRERAQLYSVASSQRRPWRRYSATMLVVLGIGAGLRTGELVAAKGRDVTTQEAGVSLRVRGARQRVVNLWGYEATLLGELVGPKNAYLFHPEEASRSYPNFVNDFARQLVASAGAAKFSAPRARSSYICDQLASGTALSTLLARAGILEVESLLRYARHVKGSPVQGGAAPPTRERAVVSDVPAHLTAERRSDWLRARGHRRQPRGDPPRDTAGATNGTTPDAAAACVAGGLVALGVGRSRVGLESGHEGALLAESSLARRARRCGRG